KTIQIISYLSILFHENAYYPYLIVVPKSTAINWVREFKKWAPEMKVVEYHGETPNRKVIEKYELYPFPDTQKEQRSLKCHVVITTYETMNMNASVFEKVPVWQALIVDEAHRLKGGASSQLFNTLKKRLDVRQSILLTGTPLQNNIEELFNLMNFLGLEDFEEPKLMAQEYEEFNKEKLDELHEKLKPYFLRRTKEQVLGFLPPKAEIIVPVAMTSLQKKLCKEILAKNVELLKTITSSKTTVAKTRKMSLQNVLMEVRKVLCHPYLMPGIEDTGIENEFIIHKNLVEASGKLMLLQKMLPKLKEKGNRVLVFSQFKMLLDIFEDFVIKEGWEYVRLDGDISGNERQSKIDAFQATDSKIFLFLLTTRAGGVGLNLTGADTVFIYDPDFNPHSDMQALSRVHRIGQDKKVLVFRFVTRSSAEERILQIGKRKLVLDHLIVEKMEEEKLDANDVESVLRFGAEALFSDETDETALKYRDEDIEKLLDRSYLENAEPTDESSQSKDLHGLSFARIWDLEKNQLSEEVMDESGMGKGSDDTENDGDGTDIWEKLIQERIQQAAQQEASSPVRMTRKRTKVVNYYEDEFDSPKKRRSKKEKSPEKPVTEDNDDEFVPKEDEMYDSSSTETASEYEQDGILALDASTVPVDKSQLQSKFKISASSSSMQQQTQNQFQVPSQSQMPPQHAIQTAGGYLVTNPAQRGVADNYHLQMHPNNPNEILYAQYMQYQQEAWRQRQRQEQERKLAYQMYVQQQMHRQARYYGYNSSPTPTTQAQAQTNNKTNQQNYITSNNVVVVPSNDKNNDNISAHQKLVQSSSLTSTSNTNQGRPVSDNFANDQKQDKNSNQETKTITPKTAPIVPSTPTSKISRTVVPPPPHVEVIDLESPPHESASVSHSQTAVSSSVNSRSTAPKDNIARASPSTISTTPISSTSSQSNPQMGSNRNSSTKLNNTARTMTSS
ncbi:3340_t:CDS:2, partial [Ambispora leptoticha]